MASKEIELTETELELIEGGGDGFGGGFGTGLREGTGAGLAVKGDLARSTSAK